MAMGKRKPSTSQSTTGNGNGNGNGGSAGPGGGGPDGGGSTTGLPLSLPNTPRGGTFYQVSAGDLEVGGDPLEAIASMMLYSEPATRDANVTVVANCIAASDWNSYFYGGDTAAAFEPQNPNALNALQKGNWPFLATGDGPTMPPSQRQSYGAIWLPDIVRGGGLRAAGGGESVAPVTCANLNPPRSLLDSLGGIVPEWAKPKGPQA